VLIEQHLQSDPGAKTFISKSHGERRGWVQMVRVDEVASMKPSQPGLSRVPRLESRDA
jgi:hypothetical protein